MSAVSRIVAIAIAIIILGIISYLFVTMNVAKENRAPDTQDTSDNSGDRTIEAVKAIDHFKIYFRLPSDRVKLGNKLALTLSVENTDSETHELSFNSSQRFDFWLEDSSGREVWRWSDGRVFAQMLETIDIKLGESISYAEDWPLMDSNGTVVEPGNYTVFAKIVANELKSEELKQGITVEPTK